MKKFSIAHLTALRLPHYELIRIAAEAGYDYVSLRTITMGLPNEQSFHFYGNPQLTDKTRLALKETGLGLHDIELARIDSRLNLEKFKHEFEIAADLGCKDVLSSIWMSDKSAYIDGFGKVCDLAAQFDMYVNLEFVTWADVDTLQKAVEVLRAVNRPNMGVMIDTLHFHRSRVALHKLDDLPKEWFRFAHICDAPEEIPNNIEDLIYTGRDARLYLGEGGIDIAAILRRIPCDCYSIELPNLKNVAQYGEKTHIIRCLTTAKEYLTKENII